MLATFPSILHFMSRCFHQVLQQYAKNAIELLKPVSITVFATCMPFSSACKDVTENIPFTDMIRHTCHKHRGLAIWFFFSLVSSIDAFTVAAVKTLICKRKCGTLNIMRVVNLVIHNELNFRC